MKTWLQKCGESLWLYVAAGALLGGGPVWHYLYVNAYPFHRPEAVVLPIAAAVIGAGISAIAYASGAIAGSVAFGALLLIFVDLQFDIAGGRLPIVILGAICIALVLLLHSRRARLTCIMLGVFYLASLPRGGRAASSPSLTDQGNGRTTSSPLLLHIVLDEQWGIGGLRSAGDTALANFLANFYLTRGFEVYTGAYSRWRNTSQSIPDMMSLGTAPRVERLERMKFRLAINPYFERLNQRGYKIHVLQSDFLDFCSTANVNVADCQVAPAVSIANIAYLQGAWTERAAIASRFFLNVNSHLYSRVQRDGAVWRRSFAGRGLHQLETARTAVNEDTRFGNAIFVHLLQPHRPYEVDHECRAGQRLYDHGIADLDAHAWQTRLRLYGGQVRCLHRALGRLIATVDSVTGRDGAIILIHGDHGSRILEPEKISLTQLNPRQLNSLYSTLLVVRRPHVDAALHTEPIPVQDFVWELVRQDFRGPIRTTWTHYLTEQSLRSSSRIDTLQLQNGLPWVLPNRH